MRYIKKTVRLMDSVPQETDTIPGHCFVERHRSRAVEVENGFRSKIKNVVFAYLAHGADFWGDPIQVADEVGSGRKVSFDLRPRSIMVKSCKLKFTSTSGTFTDSVDADLGLFVSCVGLITKPNGEFTVWWTQMALPALASARKVRSKAGR